MTDKAQRLRLTFARDDAARYLTHLDVMRMWERVLKRAALPVAYSEGFSPRPRIALAAPLAVGMTSDCELLEMIMLERVPLQRPMDAIGTQLPAGFRLLEVKEVPVGQPSLQSMLRTATYDVAVPDSRPPQLWRDAITALLARDTVPWQHMRGDDLREYDLRPLIVDAALIDSDGEIAQLRFHLRNDERGSGRCEQVTRALGAEAPPTRIRRIYLEIQEPEIARAAYRANRPDD